MTPLLDEARELHAELQNWHGVELKTKEDKLVEHQLRKARETIDVGILDDENFAWLEAEEPAEVGNALNELRACCATIEQFVQDGGGVVPYNESQDAQDALDRLDKTAMAVASRARHTSKMLLLRAFREACPYQPEQLEAMQAVPAVREDAAWLLTVRRDVLEVAGQSSPPSANVLRRHLARMDDVRERASLLDGQEVPEAVQEFITRASSPQGATIAELTNEVLTWLNGTPGAADRVKVRMER